MELDEVKKAWEKYDKNLAENLKVDEDKLRRESLEKSEDQMEYPYISEMVEIIGGGLVGIAILILSLRLIEEPKFLLAGLLTLVIGAIYIRLSFIKIGLLKQIDYHGVPILELQGRVAEVRRKIMRFRKIEMFLFPFYGLPIIPLVTKTLYNIDLFANPKLLVVKGIFFLAITLVAILLINRHLYDKRFRRVEELIVRLNEYKNE